GPCAPASWPQAWAWARAWPGPGRRARSRPGPSAEWAGTRSPARRPAQPSRRAAARPSAGRRSQGGGSLRFALYGSCKGGGVAPVRLVLGLVVAGIAQRGAVEVLLDRTGAAQDDDLLVRLGRRHGSGQRLDQPADLGVVGEAVARLGRRVV